MDSDLTPEEKKAKRLATAIIDASRVIAGYLETRHSDINEGFRQYVAQILVSMYVGTNLQHSLEQMLGMYVRAMSNMAIARTEAEGTLNLEEYTLTLTRVGMVVGAFTMEHPEWVDEVRPLLDPFLSEIINPNLN